MKNAGAEGRNRRLHFKKKIRRCLFPVQYSFFLELVLYQRGQVKLKDFTADSRDGQLRVIRLVICHFSPLEPHKNSFLNVS